MTMLREVPALSHAPSRDDLRRRVALALDLAERTVAALLEAAPRIDLNALEAPTDKVVAETALLCLSVVRLPDEPRLAARARSLAAHLEPHARNLRVQTAMMYRPFRARDLAIPHRCLEAMGLPDEAFERFVRATLTSETALSLERVPHRDLEQRWTDRLGEARPLEPWTWAHTALEQPIPTLTGSRDDLYAFTHAVLYASDFCLHSIQPCREARAVLRDVDSALASTLDDDDLDLVGELLLTWVALRVPFSPTARFAFFALCQIEDRVGVVPSLALTADAYHQQAPDAAEAYALASSYHPAYVMGLVCAQLLTRPATLETPQVQTSNALPVLEFALRTLERFPRRPYWLEVLTQLEQPERFECVSIVVDAALRRAVHAFDLGTAHKMATLAVTHGIVTTTLRQTVELLTRAAWLHVPSGD
jgi:hypothetical protein